jgi:hypothetical protein
MSMWMGGSEGRIATHVNARSQAESGWPGRHERRLFIIDVAECRIARSKRAIARQVGR